MAKLSEGQPITTSRAAHSEPLGPPPAYEQIEKESKNITSSKDIDASDFVDNERFTNTQTVPVFTSNNANLDLSASNTTSNTTMYAPRSTCRRAAKHERKQLKREHRQENRLAKREYRQDKRELRAEHRSDRNEMRRAHGGPISMLIKGVSNLMKQEGKI